MLHGCSPVIDYLDREIIVGREWLCELLKYNQLLFQNWYDL